MEDRPETRTAPRGSPTCLAGAWLADMAGKERPLASKSAVARGGAAAAFPPVERRSVRMDSRAHGGGVPLLEASVGLLVAVMPVGLC